MVGGGKSPPHIKNDVSRGRRSSIAFPKLCGMIPLEKYSSGILTSGNLLLKLPFLLGVGVID
jgi:hypothetical protein